MRRLPNVISALRIAGSISLLFCDVFNWPFWVLYASCGISDMVDGSLARRLHAETKAGAILDSVSDIVFVACCAICLLPVLEIPWLWIWAGVIVCRRAGGAFYHNKASIFPGAGGEGIMKRHALVEMPAGAYLYL